MKPKFFQRAFQFCESLVVNALFKVNDLLNRSPVLDPIPAFKLRRVVYIKIDLFVIAFESKHKPNLFLADTHWVTVVAN